MADKRGLGVEEGKSIHAERWGIESGNNLVTS